MIPFAVMRQPLVCDAGADSSLNQQERMHPVVTSRLSGASTQARGLEDDDQFIEREFRSNIGY